MKMKLTDYENQYKAFLKRQEENTDADKNSPLKNRIQERIGLSTSKPKNKVWMWSSVAASICLVCMLAFSHHQLNKKDTTIAKLNEKIEMLQNDKYDLHAQVVAVEEQVEYLKNLPPQIDTIIQTKIVYQYKAPIAQLEEDEEMESQSMASKNIMMLGNEKLDLASIQDDMASIKVEYGKKNSDGRTPYTFTINYH